MLPKYEAKCCLVYKKMRNGYFIFSTSLLLLKTMTSYSAMLPRIMDRLSAKYNGVSNYRGGKAKY